MLLACFCLHASAQSPVNGPARLAGRELQIAMTAFSRDTPVPGWVLPAPPVRARESSESITLNHADAHFRVDVQPVAYISRAVQAHRTSALAELGQHTIHFHPEYQKVDLHTLRLRRGDELIDKLKSADIRFLQREQTLDAGVFTGTVSAVMVIDDLRAGDILEVAYSLTGQNPVYGGKFVDAAAWDTSVPVLFRRVTLDLPEGRDIRYRVIGDASGTDIRPEESRAGGRRLLRFEASDLPAVAVDSHIPPDINPHRWIQFSEFASWQDVARWASELMTGQVADGELDLALASARGAGTKAEALMLALGFVQDEIRYLSVALGENSHRPYPPGQVLGRRYGDCKDKSVLLVAMLRHLGIDAEPVLVSLGSRKGLERLLPSPQAFDHVIVHVRLDGRSHFLDPTAWGQGRTLEHIGQLHAGAQYLAATPGTTGLGSVPAAPASATFTTRSESFSLDKIDGPAELKLRFEYAGLDAESMRRLMGQMPREQMRKSFEGMLDRRYSAAAMVSEPEIDDRRSENRYILTLQYRVPGLFEKENGIWTTRFRSENLHRAFFLPESSNRRHPLAVPGFPSVSRYEFEVNLPAEFDARRPSSNEILENDAFLLKETTSFSGRQLKLTQEMHIIRDRVEPADMVRFLEALRKTERVLGGRLIVRREDMKASAPAPLVTLLVASTRRLEELLSSTTAVIRDAGLSGHDPSATLCERARALANLGRSKEARSDIQEAQKLRPGNTDLLKCGGEVRYTVGDFEASISDLSRAIALRPNDAEVLFYRGLSHYYLDRLAEASKDFSAAEKLEQAAESRLRPRIWSLLTARRTGGPASGTADGKSTGVWPEAVLGLFAGKTATGDVLREAHNKSGESLDINLAEAYLYIGQHFLLQGDRLQAGVFLKRAVDKGALNSFFHAAARHELARLESDKR